MERITTQREVTSIHQLDEEWAIVAVKERGMRAIDEWTYLLPYSEILPFRRTAAAGIYVMTQGRDPLSAKRTLLYAKLAKYPPELR